MAGCSHKTVEKAQTLTIPDAVGTPAVLDSKPRGGRANFLPRAVIYRTNGPYTNNVPISVGPSGQLVSYPAPSDLRHTSPIALADGWLLDRRGVGENTRFTTYTYAQYEALPSAPPIDSLLAAVIPGARVSQAYSLPMSNGEAASDTAAVNTLIREGLPGCRLVISTPTLAIEK